MHSSGGGGAGTAFDTFTTVAYRRGEPPPSRPQKVTSLYSGPKLMSPLPLEDFWLRHRFTVLPLKPPMKHATTTTPCAPVPTPFCSTVTTITIIKKVQFCTPIVSHQRDLFKVQTCPSRNKGSKFAP